MVDTNNRILFCHKQEGNLTFCDSMDVDLEGTMLIEISPTEKDKYHMVSLIHGI